MADPSPEIQAAWAILSEAQSRMRTEDLVAGLEGLLRAAQDFRRAKDRAAESHALGLVAGVHHALGNFEQAATHRRAGLEAARSLDRPGTRVAEHLDGLAMDLAGMGRWREAERLYNQALEETDKPIYAMRKLRAHILCHLANVYTRYAGRADEALSICDEAISISLEYSDETNVAASLNMKGTALDSLYRSEEAIHHYEQARVLAERIGEEGQVAASCAHLADSYLRLGDLPAARHHGEQALTLDRKIGNKQGEGRDLWLLGRTQEEQGDEEAALETLESAFLITREVHDLKNATVILQSLAFLADRRLHGARAKSYLEQALEYARQLDDKELEIEITTSLAAYDDWSAFSSHLQEGIDAAHTKKAHWLEEQLEVALAQELERKGDLIEARTHYARAAEMLEHMRIGYRAEEHLRAFSEHHADCFERLVDISLQLRQDVEAFVWAERSRARVLQLLRASRGLRTAAGLPEARRRQYHQICDRIIALDRQIQRFEFAGEHVPRSLRQELQQAVFHEADIALTAKRASALPEGDALQLNFEPRDLIKSLQTLAQRVLVLSYYVARSGVYVMCCTSSAFYVRDLDSRPEEVRELIRQFRQSLGVEPYAGDSMPADGAESPDQLPGSDALPDYHSYSRNLYDLLLRPVQDELAATDHVCIIPHGPLHFLPFHALLDGEEYLIKRRPVSYAPSAAILAETLRDTNPAIRRSLALGDPISNLPPLPHARAEVMRIQEIMGADRCRTEIGAEATRSVVREAGQRAATGAGDDVWHFAAHAGFVQTAPHLSYLQLARSESDDGRLFAFEIATLERVPPLNVLSACLTAMTREARGDELSGLLFSFLVAGAQTVLASLWSVADKSTADLMVEFYRQVDGSDLNMAEALRQAQIKLLDIPATSSPYHWAPFTLHCNWNPVHVPAASALSVGPEQSPQSSPALLPAEVLMRQGDSFIGRARIESESRSLSPVWDGPAKAAVEQGIAIYTQVLDRQPDHAIALRQRGVAYYALDEIDHAEADLKKACDLNSRDPVAAATLGLIYSNYKKDCQAAVKHLEHAFDLDPRLELTFPRVMSHFVRQSLERCRAELVVEECSRSLIDAPDDSRLYTERGYAYWLLSIKGADHQPNEAAALQDLERALALDPNNVKALVRKAWIQSPGQGPSDVYVKAVAMDPECAEAHLRLAQSLKKEDIDRSIAEFEAALNCDPSIEHVYCELAQQHLDRADLRGATEAFEAEIERNPGCFTAHLYLTQIYAALGRREAARDALRESIRTSPQPSYQGGPGISLADSVVYGISDLARRTLATEETGGATASPIQLTSLFARADVLVKERRPREAAGVYSEILDLDPNNARAYAFRGGCLAELGDNDRAIADLRTATELNPGNADAWFNLALVYSGRMRHSESRAAMEKARLLDPDMVRRHESRTAAERDRLLIDTGLMTQGTAANPMERRVVIFEGGSLDEARKKLFNESPRGLILQSTTETPPQPGILRLGKAPAKIAATFGPSITTWAGLVHYLFSPGVKIVDELGERLGHQVLFILHEREVMFTYYDGIPFGHVSSTTIDKCRSLVNATQLPGMLGPMAAATGASLEPDRYDVRPDGQITRKTNAIADSAIVSVAGCLPRRNVTMLGSDLGRFAFQAIEHYAKIPLLRYFLSLSFSQDILDEDAVFASSTALLEYRLNWPKYLAQLYSASESLLLEIWDTLPEGGIITDDLVRSAVRGFFLLT
jgi:tetratricopeptide (TPR) repeat protein